MNTPLLQINDLHTDIEIRNGVVRALSGVDLHVNPGETLGIVGESGSGKTMTALSLMGLLPQGGKVSSGSIILDGQDLTKMPLHLKRKMRGTKVGMIFQDPLTSLNPTMKIGLQVCEPLRVHEKLSKREALARAVEILKRVGMPRPEVVINNYPHQLSGGMRQRVMIAMALVCKPRILIADEPTTALDVTTQMQILDLIDELRDEYKMGVILITHDLGVVAGHTDRVAVMYAGRIVETAPTKTLFTEPKHRYTSSLMAALPERALAAGTKLFSIPGAPPSLTNLPGPLPVGHRRVPRELPRAGWGRYPHLLLLPPGARRRRVAGGPPGQAGFHQRRRSSLGRSADLQRGAAGRQGGLARVRVGRLRLLQAREGRRFRRRPRVHHGQEGRDLRPRRRVRLR